MLIEIPEWVPPLVALRISFYCDERWPEQQYAILRRLATDSRMRGVWKTLSSKDRESGLYQYPGNPDGSRPTADDGWSRALLEDFPQQEAMSQLFYGAFDTMKSQRAVTKREENQKYRDSLLYHSRQAQEMADELRENGTLGDADDIAALERVALRFKADASQIRGDDDPLTVQRHREHSSVVIGAHRDCIVHLERLFGRKARGLAATLVNVGLDLKGREELNRSISRNIV